MARGKNDRLERKLAHLEAATEDARSEEATAALRGALEGKDAYVAARAGELIREAALEGFEDPLEAALHRLLALDAKADPRCHGKLALVEALDALDARAPEAFVGALRCVQIEPGYGGGVDTAVSVRIRGVLALARAGEPDFPLLAAEALADPSPQVRAAGLRGLALHGDRQGASLARLVLGREEAEPEVLGEAMSAFVALAPDVGVPWLAARLREPDPMRRELAAIALGESHRPDAFDALLEAMADAVTTDARRPFYTALALHRSEPALRALLPWIEGAEVDAEAVLEALAVRRFEADVRDRVRSAAESADRLDLFDARFES